MGRSDDVINVAGHRLSTGEMEEVVAAHPSVAECAVFASKDNLKGQVPVAMVVTKEGCIKQDIEIADVIRASFRAQIGAITCLQTIQVVERFPNPRSGKILRTNLRQLVDGEQLQVPSTIEDPSVIEEIQAKWVSLNN